MDHTERQRRVDAIDFWYHSIDVGDGIVTPGQGGGTPWMLDRIGLPEDLTGKRVLDIGAWDGFFTFAAEERGAEVVSVDHFVWNEPDVGMGGYLTAHELRGSKATWIDLDVDDISEETVGRFDIVLFLGVLYHRRDPMRALAAAASVCDELLIVESEVTFIGEPHTPLARFYEGDELWGDPTNWFAPNPVAMAGMLRANGCVRVEEIDRWGETPPFEKGGLPWLKAAFYRAGLHIDRQGIHRNRGNGRSVMHGWMR